MEQRRKPDSILGRPGLKIRARSLFLFIACIAVSAVLVGRLIYLQIIKYEDYRRAVVEQMVYETKITASRGMITDKNGVVLATNYTTERVFISPYDMKNNNELCKLVSKGLSEILGVDYDFIYGETQKTSYKDRTIKKNVEKEDADKVRQFITDNSLSCIHLVETATRIYPFSTLASHVIGFCGTDGGLYGLEYQYNSILTGTSGKIVAAQNGKGGSMPYDYEVYIDAKNGANLVTTIDYKIQGFLEKHLEDAAIEAGCKSRACGIVMNPKTGEIYAMATYPYYDLNNPRALPSYYNDIVEGYKNQYGEDSKEYSNAISTLLLTMWNNKCITDTYEPGSTAKIITTSIAIEENLAKTTDMFNCSGSYTVSGWVIKCHKRSGHGSLNFAQGLQQSCNPVMMKLSERIGISTYSNYFSAFGFTEKTGIDLPGEASSIYKSQQDMTNLDLAVYSFGQRFNVTPMQLISAVSAVANGGTLVTPHIIKAVLDDDGNTLASFGTTKVRQVISEETAATISQILAEGVSTDGGAKNAYVKGYSVAAKTGTSEKGTVGNKRIVSTIGYAPSDDAEVICIMIIDEPTLGSIYGSTLVAPYISKLLGDILPYLGIEPNYTEEELLSMDMNVQNYRGLSLDRAKKLISDLGLKYEVVGTGDSVVKQVPSSGSRMSKENGRIILYTENVEDAKDSVVPNVVGMTAEKANKALTDAGLNVKITGATIGSGAVVHSQSIPAGTVTSKGTVVSIEMRFAAAEGDE